MGRWGPPSEHPGRMAAHHPGSTTSRPVPAARPASPGRELVLQTIARHGSWLLASARRYSLCADDAQDAYQRGLEIFLRHADGLRPDGAAAWLRTVVKHEALAVRAARLRLVSPGEPDLDLYEAGDTPADERAASLERLGHSAEALAQLKPQEVRALVLKAHGYSYLELYESLFGSGSPVLWITGQYSCGTPSSGCGPSG